jgi:nucleolar complex protein 3
MCIDSIKPITTVQLLAYRETRIELLRYKIGILSSEILENPEEKSNNLKILLELMEGKVPEIYVTIRKLSTASLLEIFKDLLPSYNIKTFYNNEVKCKII